MASTLQDVNRKTPDPVIYRSSFPFGLTDPVTTKIDPAGGSGDKNSQGSDHTSRFKFIELWGCIIQPLPLFIADGTLWVYQLGAVLSRR